MTDSWAMALAQDMAIAQDLQVYTSPDPQPSTTASASAAESLEDQNGHGRTADDGYSSCCSSNTSELGSEGAGSSCSYTIDFSIYNHLSRSYCGGVRGTQSETKRLKKNLKQRNREWTKKLHIDVLKEALIKSPLVDVKPKGSRKFTEYDTLKYAKELIEKLKLQSGDGK